MSLSAPNKAKLFAKNFSKNFNLDDLGISLPVFHSRISHAGLLHKLRSYGIYGQIFDPISSFLSNRRLRVVLDRKSSQEHPVNAGVPQGSILGPTLF